MSSTKLPRVVRSPLGRRAGGVAGVLMSAGLMLSIVGCGSEEEPPPPAEGDSELSLEQTAEPGTTEQEPEDEPVEEQNAGGDYCDVLEKFGDDILSAAAGDPDGAGEFIEVYREIAAAAPEDVAADWNSMADAMELLDDIDYSDPEAASKLAELEDLGQVAERLGRQVQEDCA